MNAVRENTERLFEYYHHHRNTDHLISTEIKHLKMKLWQNGHSYFFQTYQKIINVLILTP